MSDQPPASPEDLKRQLALHAESLRAAGVEWLTAPSPLPAPTLASSSPQPPDTGVAPPQRQAQVLQASLFEEPPQPYRGETAVLPAEQRCLELEVLAERVSECTRCAGLAATRTQTVFGVGPIDPDLCFIGEAPGATEDRVGQPFVGDAGQLLNRIIAACGMKREEVYICNIIKCRPPGNRQPNAEEAAHCREYLEKQLELVRPRFICAMGATAAQYLLNTKQSISRMRGHFQDYRGIPVMCTFHPAFLLRSPERKRDVWEDMKKLLARMGRPVPSR